MNPVGNMNPVGDTAGGKRASLWEIERWSFKVSLALSYLSIAPNHPPNVQFASVASSKEKPQSIELKKS
jgi:hypothetical protein